MAELFGKHGLQIDGFVVDEEYAVDGQHDFSFYKREFSSGPFFIILAITDKQARDRVQSRLTNEPVNVQIFYLGDDYPAGIPFISSEYLNSHKEKLFTVYNLLEDNLSRKCMRRFLEAKLSGECFCLQETQAESGKEYFNEVFPYRTFSDSCVFLDGGAYTGDTFEEYISLYGYKKYYAIEPDGENFKTIKETTENSHDICLLKAALSDEDSSAFVAENCSTGLSSRLVDSTDGNLNARTKVIDTVTIDQVAPDATFIKLDIEGYELKALQGASKTISKNLSGLAICCYHKAEDIFEIPLFIKSINSNYKLFFRQHYSEIARDLILYAYV